jgi:hypothetical protein
MLVSGLFALYMQWSNGAPTAQVKCPSTSGYPVPATTEANRKANPPPEICRFHPLTLFQCSTASLDHHAVNEPPTQIPSLSPIPCSFTCANHDENFPHSTNRSPPNTAHPYRLPFHPPPLYDLLSPNPSIIASCSHRDSGRLLMPISRVQTSPQT